MKWFTFFLSYHFPVIFHATQKYILSSFLYTKLFYTVHQITLYYYTFCDYLQKCRLSRICHLSKQPSNAIILVTLNIKLHRTKCNKRRVFVSRQRSLPPFFLFQVTLIHMNGFRIKLETSDVIFKTCFYLHLLFVIHKYLCVNHVADTFGKKEIF